MVPNPYTLLTTLSRDFSWFTVLDLKVAFFFCNPMSPDPQDLFTFDLEDPNTRVKEQYCWIVLPPGLQELPPPSLAKVWPRI